MKPYCNAVEVETRQQAAPAPETLEGLGYSAGCYALGGKINLAREAIERTPADQQYKAAGIVFALAHPVADAGDDKSAGPIMELVLEFWPNHYQARYHAGMSSYILGDVERAGMHLTRFVDEYRQNDGWRRNALEVLERVKN
jgi:thioredoxin-like negative regulator of GroEL